MLYITENCYNAIMEISKYAGQDKDDHLVSVCKHFAGRHRPYFGDDRPNIDSYIVKTHDNYGSGITGY